MRRFTSFLLAVVMIFSLAMPTYASSDATDTSSSSEIVEVDTTGESEYPAEEVDSSSQIETEISSDGETGDIIVTVDSGDAEAEVTDETTSGSEDAVEDEAAEAEEDVTNGSASDEVADEEEEVLYEQEKVDSFINTYISETPDIVYPWNEYKESVNEEVTAFIYTATDMTQEEIDEQASEMMQEKMPYTVYEATEDTYEKILNAKTAWDELRDAEKEAVNAVIRDSYLLKMEDEVSEWTDAETEAFVITFDDLYEDAETVKAELLAAQNAADAAEADLSDEEEAQEVEEEPESAEYNGITADAFIQDYLSDEDGNIIIAATESNAAAILESESVFFGMDPAEQDLVNAAIAEACEAAECNAIEYSMLLAVAYSSLRDAGTITEEEYLAKYLELTGIDLTEYATLEDADSVEDEDASEENEESEDPEETEENTDESDDSSTIQYTIQDYTVTIDGEDVTMTIANTAYGITVLAVDGENVGLTEEEVADLSDGELSDSNTADTSSASFIDSTGIGYTNVDGYGVASLKHVTTGYTSDGGWFYVHSGFKNYGWSCWTISRINEHYAVTSDGYWHPVYCIEPNNAGNDTVVGTSSDGAWWDQLTEAQRDDICLVLAYGYPLNSETASNTSGSMAATQLLVWEVAAGYLQITNGYSHDYTFANHFKYSSAWIDNAAYCYNSICDHLYYHGVTPDFTYNTVNDAVNNLVVMDAIKTVGSTKYYTTTLTNSGTGNSYKLNKYADSDAYLNKFTFTAYTDANCTKALSDSQFYIERSADNKSITFFVASSAFSSKVKQVYIKVTTPSVVTTSMQVRSWAPGTYGNLSQYQSYIEGVSMTAQPAYAYIALKPGTLTLEINKIADRQLSSATKTSTGVEWTYANDKPLANVTFRLLFAEDTTINGTTYKTGTVAVDSTGSAIAAKTTDVYGTDDWGNVTFELLNRDVTKYILEETVTPYIYSGADGTLANESHTVQYSVTMDSAGVTTKTIKDYMGTEGIKIYKTDTDTGNAIDVTGFTFGIYAASDITNYQGTVVVKKDTLLYTVKKGADNVTVKTDSNGAKYYYFYDKDFYTGASFYIKELSAPADYLLNNSVLTDQDGNTVINLSTKWAGLGKAGTFSSGSVQHTFTFTSYDVPRVNLTVTKLADGTITAADPDETTVTDDGQATYEESYVITDQLPQKNATFSLYYAVDSSKEAIVETVNATGKSNGSKNTSAAKDSNGDYVLGDLVGTATTDKNGKISFSNLKQGKYILIETSAQDGLNVVDESVNIRSDGMGAEILLSLYTTDNGEIRTVEYTATDTLVKSYIGVTKRDSSTDEIISKADTIDAAAFALYATTDIVNPATGKTVYQAGDFVMYSDSVTNVTTDPVSLEKVYETSTDGIHTIDGVEYYTFGYNDGEGMTLLPGQYEVREVKAPTTATTPYIKSNVSFSISVNQGKTSTFYESGCAPIQMFVANFLDTTPNDTSLYVKKYTNSAVSGVYQVGADTADKTYSTIMYAEEPLDGVVFALYEAVDEDGDGNPDVDSNGDYVLGAKVKSSTTTSGTADFSGIQPGKYILIEESAPQGYNTAVFGYWEDSPASIPEGETNSTSMVNAATGTAQVYLDMTEATLGEEYTYTVGGETLSGISFDIYKIDSSTGAYADIYNPDWANRWDGTGEGAEFTIWAAEDITNWKGSVAYTKDTQTPLDTLYIRSSDGQPVLASSAANGSDYSSVTVMYDSEKEVYYYHVEYKEFPNINLSLTETYAPFGYKVSEDSFTVFTRQSSVSTTFYTGEDGNVDASRTATVRVYDQPTTVDLSAVKMLSESIEKIKKTSNPNIEFYYERNIKQGGVTFSLYEATDADGDGEPDKDANGDYVISDDTLVETLTTETTLGEDFGKVTFKGLRLGWYILVESEVPTFISQNSDANQKTGKLMQAVDLRFENQPADEVESQTAYVFDEPTGVVINLYKQNAATQEYINVANDTDGDGVYDDYAEFQLYAAEDYCSVTDPETVIIPAKQLLYTINPNTDAENVTVEVASTTDGAGNTYNYYKVTIEKLPPISMYMMETKAPAGYSLNEEPSMLSDYENLTTTSVYQDVDSDLWPTASGSIADEPLVDIQVTKYASEAINDESPYELVDDGDGHKVVSWSTTTETLENVKFRLYEAIDTDGDRVADVDDEGNYVFQRDTPVLVDGVTDSEGNIITDENGIATWTQLPQGVYILVEMSAADEFTDLGENWRLDTYTDEDFDVNGQPMTEISAYVGTDGNTLLKFERPDEGGDTYILIAKYDDTTNQLVETVGAEFGLYTAEDIYDDDGNLLIEAGTLVATSKSTAAILAKEDTWFAERQNSVAKTSVETIQFSTQVPNNYTASWDASADQNGTIMAYYNNGTVVLVPSNGATTYIYANPDSKGAFSGFENLQSISGIYMYNTNSAQNMEDMFSGDAALSAIYNKEDNSNTYTYDLTNFSTGNVTDMSGMFHGCANAGTIKIGPDFVTAHVTDMSYMFAGCSALTYFGNSSGKAFGDGFYTINVTNMSHMFHGCTALTNFGDVGSTGIYNANFNTSNVTDMSYMFARCSSATELNFSEAANFKVSNVTNFDCMFSGDYELTTLNVSSFNTASAENTHAMFYKCSKVAELDITGFISEKVSSDGNMFYGMNKLAKVVLDGSWDFTEDGLLPTPKSGTDYITAPTGYGVDGKWHELYVVGGKHFKPAEVSYENSQTCANNETPLTVYAYQNVTPYIAETDSWFTRKTSVKTSVKTITVQSEPYTGTFTTSWDASWYEDGTVKAYFNSSTGELVIAPVLTSAKIQTYADDNKDGLCDKEVNSSSMFAGFTNATTITGLECIDTTNSTTLASAFSGDSAAGTISNLKSWNIGNVTSTWRMFYNCSSVTSLDLGGDDWNGSNLTLASQMFRGCSSLETLSLSTKFNPKKSTSFYGMFYNCTKLLYNGNSMHLDSWTTDAATTMAYMFDGCESLSTIATTNWNTSNVTDMSYMFKNCKALTTLNLANFNTANVTNMHSMFENCWKLETLSLGDNFTTTNVTDMAYMFKRCYLLTSIGGVSYKKWDTANVTTMQQMFLYCNALTSLDLSQWDTSNVSNMSKMFFYAGHIATLNLGGSFSTKAVTDGEKMFTGMRALKQVTLGEYFSFPTNTVLPKPSTETTSWTDTADGGDNASHTTGKVTADTGYYVTGCWYVASGDTSPNGDTEGWSYAASEVPNGGECTYIAYGADSIMGSGTNWAGNKYTSYYQGKVTAKVDSSLSLAVSGITKVSFVDGVSAQSIKSKGYVYWDASYAGDWSVIGYRTSSKSTEVNIAAVGRDEIKCAEFSGGGASASSAGMFKNMSSLTTITGYGKVNLGTDDDGATSIAGMFEGCSALYLVYDTTKTADTVDLTAWTKEETSKITNMSTVFSGCSSMKKLNISTWSTKGVEKATNMFNGNTNLAFITVGSNYSWNGNGDTKIYFPQSTDYAGTDAEGKSLVKNVWWYIGDNDAGQYNSQRNARGNQTTSNHITGKQTYRVYGDKCLVSITASLKHAYWHGQKVDPKKDVEVTATYSNGDTATVTSSATIGGTAVTSGVKHPKGTDMACEASQTVTVSYTEGGITQTCEIKPTVYRQLKSISIKTSASTTKYAVGSDFDKTGITLTATYTCGCTATISNGSVKSEDNTNMGWSTTAAVVSYEETGITAYANQPVVMYRTIKGGAWKASNYSSLSKIWDTSNTSVPWTTETTSTSYSNAWASYDTTDPFTTKANQSGEATSYRSGWAPENEYGYYTFKEEKSTVESDVAYRSFFTSSYTGTQYNNGDVDLSVSIRVYGDIIQTVQAWTTWGFAASASIGTSDAAALSITTYGADAGIQPYNNYSVYDRAGYFGSWTYGSEVNGGYHGKDAASSEDARKKTWVAQDNSWCFNFPIEATLTSGGSGGYVVTSGAFQLNKIQTTNAAGTEVKSTTYNNQWAQGDMANLEIPSIYYNIDSEYVQYGDELSLDTPAVKATTKADTYPDPANVSTSATSSASLSSVAEFFNSLVSTVTAWFGGNDTDDETAEAAEVTEAATSTEAYAKTNVAATRVLSESVTPTGTATNIKTNTVVTSEQTEVSSDAGYYTINLNYLDGEYFGSRLPAGKYYVREITPPSGYYSDPDDHEYTYFEGDEDEFDTNYFNNEIVDSETNPERAASVANQDVFFDTPITGLGITVTKTGSKGLSGATITTKNGTVSTKWTYTNNVAVQGATFTLYKAVTNSSGNAVKNSDGTYKKGSVVTTARTNSEGKAYFTGLEKGLYIVVETAAPNNYSTAKKTEQLVDLSNVDNLVFEYAAAQSDTYTTGGIQITKKSAITGNQMSGSGYQFTLYAGADITGYDGKTVVKADTAIFTFDSSSAWNGVYTFSGLPAGTYYVVETKCPSGQSLNTQKYYVTVNDGETKNIEISTSTAATDSEDITIENITSTGKVLVYKYDNNGDAVRGCTFELAVGSKDIVDAEGNVYSIEVDGKTIELKANTVIATKTSNSKGFASFADIELPLKIADVGAGGEFTVREISTGSTGLDISDVVYTFDTAFATVEDYIAEFGSTTADAVYTFTFTNYDSEHGDILVIKDAETVTGLDTVNGGFEYEWIYLQGAEFTLYAAEDIEENGSVVYKSGDVVVSDTTGSDGTITFSNLPYGTYTLVETDTAEGWALNLDPNYNGNIPGTMTTSAEDPGYDFGADEDDDDTTIDRINVNSTATSYTTETTIEVDGTSGSHVYTAELWNPVMGVNLKVWKTASGSDIPLEGFDFTLYAGEDITYCDTNGKTYTIAANTSIGTITTNENGLADFSSFRVPVGYSYYIKETGAPAGYEVSDEVKTFTTSLDGDAMQEFEFYYEDSVKSGLGMTFVKYAETDSADMTRDVNTGDIEYTTGHTTLEGAVFALYTTSGTKLMDGITTDENGMFSLVNTASAKEKLPNAYVVTSLTEGTEYVLKETEAPEGYETCADLTFTFTKDSTEAIGIIDKETSSARATVWKYTVANGEEQALSWGYKVDDDGNYVLDDNGEKIMQYAEFTLFAGEDMSSSVPSGTALETVQVDDNGYATFTTSLETGKSYYIRETQAPGGYTLNTEVFTFTVSAEDENATYDEEGVLTFEFKCEDTPKPDEYDFGSIAAKKVDENGDPVEGVQFVLEWTQDDPDSEDAVWEPVYHMDEEKLTKPIKGATTADCGTNGKLTTNAEGEVRYDSLYAEESDPIYYRLTEVKAPDNMTVQGVVFLGQLPYRTDLLADKLYTPDSIPDDYEFTADAAFEYDVEVEIVNDFSVGSISVEKQDNNGGKLAGVTYLLEYSTDDGDTWAAVFGDEEYEAYRESLIEEGADADSIPTSGLGTPGYCTSENLKDGTLTTTEDENPVVFTGLTADGKTVYRLKETATPSGYTLLASPVYEGSLPRETKDEDGNITLVYDLSFIVTETSAFEIPATGGSGFNGFILVSMTGTVLAAAAMWFALKSRKRKESVV